jgi:hypothetical protein
MVGHDSGHGYACGHEAEWVRPSMMKLQQLAIINTEFKGFGGS